MKISSATICVLLIASVEQGQAICESETEAEIACLNAISSETYQACSDCIEGTSFDGQTFASCDEIGNAFCGAIDQCDDECGMCHDEVEASAICGFHAGLDLSENPSVGNCDVVCSPYSPVASQGYPPAAPPVYPPTAPPTDPSSIDNSENSSTNIGPIIGGAIGGLAVVCATFLGMYFMQKQKRGRSEQSQFESNKQSAPDVAERDGQDHTLQTTDASTAQPSISTWATPDSYQTNPQPQPVPTCTRNPSAGPPQSPGYMPNFKDQARSVAAPVPPVVEAIPVEDFIPHRPTPELYRVALDP